MSDYQSTLCKDVYKEFHVRAGHPDIVETYENFTNRDGRLSNVRGNSHVVNLGWQYVIKKHLIERWNTTFFQVDKEAACKRHQVVMSSILGYTVDVDYLRKLHDLGFLPLQIKALPEGTLVPYKVASATFRSTVEGFEWLPGMLETVISQEVWPIQTSATTTLAYLRKQKEFFKETGAPMELLPFMIHDFSARGCFGEDASAMSGFGHLAAGSVGSDTIAAGLFAEKYYGADWEKELVMASVNATEHSVTCGWVDEGEEAYFRHLMTNVAPEGILAVVSDTWSFWNTVTKIAANLKDDIMNRTGKVVFRPDSGDPVDILCGSSRNFDTLDEAVMEINDEHTNQAYADCAGSYNMGCDKYETVVMVGDKAYRLWTPFEYNRHDKEYYYIDCYGDNDGETRSEECEATPEMKGLVEVLWDTFGGTKTSKGFKMLDEHVGAIYGDAITLERQAQIGERLMAKGFVPQVVLGVGSFSFQYVTRDTHGSAMKATNVTKRTVVPDEKGEPINSAYDQPIFKDPKTDSKKKSAKGLLRIEREDGELVQYDMQSWSEEDAGLLQVVFRDGVLYNEQTLEGIRELVASQA